MKKDETEPRPVIMSCQMVGDVSAPVVPAWARFRDPDHVRLLIRPVLGWVLCQVQRTIDGVWSLGTDNELHGVVLLDGWPVPAPKAPGFVGYRLARRTKSDEFDRAEEKELINEVVSVGGFKVGDRVSLRSIDAAPDWALRSPAQVVSLVNSVATVRDEKQGSSHQVHIEYLYKL